MKKELLKKKKMLLVYALVTSLSVSTLSGCGANTFNYQLTEDGSIVIDGSITYDKFKKLKFVHLTNEIAKIDKYILVEEKEYVQRYTSSKLCYIDVETGKIVYNNKDDDFKNFKLEIVIEHMVDYLYKYDMVKDEYSIEDIEKLKEYLLLDEDLNKDKETSLEVGVLKRRKIYC